MDNLITRKKYFAAGHRHQRDCNYLPIFGQYFQFITPSSSKEKKEKKEKNHQKTFGFVMISGETEVILFD